MRNIRKENKRYVLLDGRRFWSEEFCFTIAEVRCVLTALDNKIRFQNGQPLLKKLCSHSHESEFLHKNDSRILNGDIQTQWKIFTLYHSLESLAETEQPMKCLYLELLKLTENKHYTEIILFVASILIDFHFDSDCSDYMSLALKFYLNVYNFISYGLDEGINNLTVKSDLVNYLKYITMRKLKRELFVGYLKVFLRYYGCNRPFDSVQIEDSLYYILEELFELSRGFKFNFLSLVDIVQYYHNNHFVQEKYAERSILEFCERYIVLAKHGFEDRYYENAIKDYMVEITKIDVNDKFGIPDNGIGNVRSMTHRCAQLLFLYVKQYYENGASEICKKTLQILWETITDPFLTKQQFLSCFQGSRAEIHVEVVKAWYWYEKNVLFDENNTKTSPRTLSHITKCYIRRRLTELAHLPSEVESFDIPWTLKNYLCVESLQLSLPS